MESECQKQKREDINKMVQEMNQAYYRFCNTIITLSTGGLMLSMIFVQTSNCRIGVNWLVVSWMLFILAIMSALIIKWGEIRAYCKCINTVRLNVSKEITIDPGKLYRNSRKVMILCFLMAIVCLSVFAVRNILKTNVESTQDTKTFNKSNSEY